MHPVLFVFTQKTDKFQFVANGMRAICGWCSAGSQFRPHIHAFGSQTIRRACVYEAYYATIQLLLIMYLNVWSICQRCICQCCLLFKQKNFYRLTYIPVKLQFLGKNGTHMCTNPVRIKLHKNLRFLKNMEKFEENIWYSSLK